MYFKWNSFETRRSQIPEAEIYALKCPYLYFIQGMWLDGVAWIHLA
jgi:hypothetical protein